MDEPAGYVARPDACVGVQPIFASASIISRPRNAARHLHGGWKGGGAIRCRDARSGSLQRSLGGDWLVWRITCLEEMVASPSAPDVAIPSSANRVSKRHQRCYAGNECISEHGVERGLSHREHRDNQAKDNVTDGETLPEHMGSRPPLNSYKDKCEQGKQCYYGAGIIVIPCENSERYDHQYTEKKSPEVPSYSATTPEAVGAE